MPTGPISSISGCFLWYKADAIGTLPSGNPIQFWQDLSGSGNNLTPFGAVSGNSPSYIPNSINGLPVVQFAGTNELTIANNQSLNLKNNNLALFTVFSTSTTLQQPICSLDVGSQESHIGFIIGVGDNTSDVLVFESSSDTISSTSGISTNQYVIRTDRFDNNSNLLIEYFNQAIASGNTSISTAVAPNFNVGFAPYSNYAGQDFQGRIAEIVGYNLPLQLSDKTLVYNYLYNKYFGGTPTPTPTPTPPPFHLPTDLSGCFAWYLSTSIGITGIDGSPVQTWIDSSGSGTDVSIDFTQSGTWVTPTFHRNQINGYPTVRFANGSNYGYLFSSLNNSLNFSSTDFTGFAVFKANDNIDTQCLYSFSSADTTSNFNSLINYNNNNSFDLTYTYAGSGQVVLTANNTNLGKHMYDTGQCVIRHDRFRSLDNEFIFGSLGADVASGYASSSFGASRLLTLGGTYHLSNQFTGDLAEVICYRRELSQKEVDYVNNYLLQKYLPANVGTASLFINSVTHSGIYNDIPLYTMGGNSGVNNTLSLYIGSTTVANSSVSLFTNSVSNTQSGNTTLYIESSHYLNNSLTLYTESTTGTTFAHIPLYIESSSTYSNNLPLFIYGNTHTQSGLSLYTQNSKQQFPPITLFIDCGSSINIPIKLYTAGSTAPSITGRIPLFLHSISAATSGLFKSMPLYLGAGNIHSGIPLYLKVTPIDTHPSSAMPLFIGTPNVTGYYSYSTSLYISNTTSGFTSPTKRLFISGLGTLQDGLIDHSNMILFLQQTGVTPIINNSHSISPLYINCGNISNNNFNLYMINHANIATGVSMFQHGKVDLSGGMNTYIEGRNLGFEETISLYSRGF